MGVILLHALFFRTYYIVSSIIRCLLFVKISGDSLGVVAVETCGNCYSCVIVSGKRENIEGNHSLRSLDVVVSCLLWYLHGQRELLRRCQHSS